MNSKGNHGKLFMLFFAVSILAIMQFLGNEALGQGSFFTSQGCAACHAAPAVATCNGCHYHGPTALRGVTNKTSYAPAEPVSVTISGGNKSGWFRAVLYDQNSVELARSTGNASGMGSSATYPAVLTAPAPATAGTYTWKVAWYGHQYDTSALGSGWVPDANNAEHGEVLASTNSFTVASAVPLADTTAPMVGTFTLPTTATNLTVPVNTFTATDNIGVTGYLVTTRAVAPTADTIGWSTTPPATVVAPAGGGVTFYAWVKDAAGNVSAAKATTVVIILPPVSDTSAPVVTSFSMPATSPTLTVPVGSFSATDNVGVTGYIITTSTTSTGWALFPPASAPAAAPGVVTFYAWAMDAAGNVSAAKSATVAIATPTTTPPAASTLAVSTLSDGSYTNNATLNVSGIASAEAGLQSVTVNGQNVAVSADGSFSTALALNIGTNAIAVIATDLAGNQKSDTRSVTYDPNAPVLTVAAPIDNSITTQSFATVSGTVNETSTVTVAVNSGSPQDASVVGGSFIATAYLASGVNTIDISATDQAGNISHAKRTVTFNSSTRLTMAVTNPNQDITTSNSTLVLLGTVSNSTPNITVTIIMDGTSYKPEMINNTFRQQLTFSSAKQYAITVTATDIAGNSATVTRNVIYSPVVTGTTGHPFGWTNPRSSHQDYAEKNGVSGCIGCHSIDQASKGQKMSCYNCHGKEWDTPTTGVGSTGGTTTGHPFGWTNPRSSHQDYAEKNGVSGCIGCHSIDQASKGQAMSCYNCHGKEWDTPATGAPPTGGTTSHPFGWTNPRSSHQDYAEKNGVSGCIGCHSIDQASKGQAMSCYNCHGKEWDTPATGAPPTGGTSGGHPFGWTNPRSSHQDYAEKNGVSGCIGCHSIDQASKGQAMSCYNCHGKEWDTPTSTGTTGGTTTGHPFGWTNPRSSHQDYVEENGVSGCSGCHSTDQASKGQAMSCYNCHGKEW